MVARRSGSSIKPVAESSHRRAEPPAPTRGPQAGGKATTQSPLRLDRLIHERLRLGIVSALAVNEHLTFHELKKLLQTTDGNLIVHARKLEEAAYISSHKSLNGGVSRTEYRITPAGRRALDKYVAHMEAILGAMRG
jgi:DNA-binding MarR family transcriptional regulator